MFKKKIALLSLACSYFKLFIVTTTNVLAYEINRKCQKIVASN